MKIMAFTTCALVTSWSTVHAAEYTNAQLTAFNASMSDAAFEKACAKSLPPSSATTVDLDTLSDVNPCGDTDCMAYMKNLQAKAPKCEVSGFSVPALFDLIFSLCEVLPKDLGNFTTSGMASTSTKEDFTTSPTSTSKLTSAATTMTVSTVAMAFTATVLFAALG